MATANIFWALNRLLGIILKFSTSGFFHESVFSWPLSILFGKFLIFTKIRGVISNFVFIADTGDKTGDIILPVLYFRISPWIFVKIRNGPRSILRGPGETDSWKKNLKSKILCKTTFNKNNVKVSGTVHYTPSWLVWHFLLVQCLFLWQRYLPSKSRPINAFSLRARAHTTNGVVDFIWKGRGSWQVSIRTNQYNKSFVPSNVVKP